MTALAAIEKPCRRRMVFAGYRFQVHRDRRLNRWVGESRLLKLSADAPTLSALRAQCECVIAHATELPPPDSKPRVRNARKALGWNGRMFDSTAERDRYDELRLLERAGEITELSDPNPTVVLAGIKYRADSRYIERGRCVTEDVKGPVSDRFRLICQLWRLHGDSVLRIVKRSGRRAGFQVVKEIPGGTA